MLRLAHCRFACDTGLAGAATAEPDWPESLLYAQARKIEDILKIRRILSRSTGQPVGTIGAATASSPAARRTAYGGFGEAWVDHQLPDTLPFFALPDVPFTFETLRIILPFSITLAFVGLATGCAVGGQLGRVDLGFVVGLIGATAAVGARRVSGSRGLAVLPVCVCVL